MATKRIEDIIISLLDKQDHSPKSLMDKRITGTSEVCTEENCDGTVAVIDGKLIVKNPVGLGKYPTISPGPAVKVIANGHPVSDIEIVTENTHLEVSIQDEEPESDFQIVISEDELDAYCSILYRPGKRYRLADQDEKNHLLLRAEVTAQIRPSVITLAEVNNQLAALGIIHGIMLEELEKELKEPTGKPVLVARGIAPVPAQDPWVEYFFDINDRILPQVVDNGRVDYLEHGQIQTVKIGTVLALKHPPIPGKSGLTITGKEIKAGEIRDIEINIGKGVELVDDGQKAVATLDGRPVLRGLNKTIHILPQLTVRGDVDISTGHVKFNGDVVVQGNVMERLVVQASGRVTVLGNIYSGRIIAGDHVYIKGNVVNSQICAGGNSAFFARVIPIFNALQSELSGIVAAVGQLKSNAMFLMQDLHIKGDGNLIKLLIDAKFRKIPKMVEILDESAQSAVYKLESIITDFIKLLKLKLTGTGPLNIRSLDEVVQIQQLCTEIIRQGEESIQAKANVTVRYAQNCFIEATGFVQVFGQGSYQTQIFAGKEVEVLGVFRGGEIRAGRSVKISVAGSNAAVQTKIEVGEKGTVAISKVFPNVQIKVGRQTFKSDYGIQNFQCYQNSQNNLIIEGNKMGGIINA